MFIKLNTAENQLKVHFKWLYYLCIILCLVSEIINNYTL